MRTLSKLSLFLIPLVVSGCRTSGRSTPSSFPEHSYSEIEHLKIRYEDCMKKEEELYLLYFYQETCADCGLIKNNIIDFALNNIKPIYFIEVDPSMPHKYSYNELDKTIGCSEYTETWVGVTPNIVTIDNHKVADNRIGAMEVEYVLSSYRS